MAFEFILLFGQLNLVSVTCEKKEQIIQETKLTDTKAVKIFEYGKK